MKSRYAPIVRTWLAVFLALVGLGLSAGVATAQNIQWYVEVLNDPITQKPALEARILTAKGYRFHLMIRPDNSIWAEFRLPRQMEALVSPKRLPVYWVDNRDPTDLEKLKELEVGFKPTLYEIGEKLVRFIIWGAVRPGEIPPPLQELMLGETLHIRYWNQVGEMQQTEIPLRRANEAIAQMLRVPPLSRAPDVANRRTETFATVAKHYLEFCEELRFVGSDGEYSSCRDLFVACSEKPDQTVDSLKQCLKYVP